MDAITSLLVPIHREGTRFIIAFAIATLVLFLIWEPLGWIGVILTLWCVYFFRDPDRLTPARKGLVIAPADGVVNMITDAAPPPELGLGEEPRPRISIFMNVFNCHVNRIPIAGRVTRTAYKPGKFLNADLDKASEDNERAAIVIETEEGKTFVSVQIAGLVARRIVNGAVEGQSYETGERYGIIRFGSRVDVYLEPGMAPLVAVGQTMVAGETVLADTESSEERREAAVR